MQKNMTAHKSQTSRQAKKKTLAEAAMKRQVEAQKRKEKKAAQKRAQDASKTMARKYVRAPMNTQQEVAVAFNEDGHLLICHSEPFDEPPGWVECDAEQHKIFVMTQAGSLHDTGLVLHSDLFDDAKQAHDASLIWVVDEKINDIFRLPVIYRDTKLV